MTGSVRQERDGAVAILTIEAPPVNALGAAVRAGLAEGLAAALADPGVGAVVLRAVGATFSAGADIREFGHAPAADVPSLPDLCDRIEASGKPVIAAVQGAALGGGMELALAAHVRLAGPGARFGLPEVALGLLPGAGGTQRTPRLIGAEAALRMMLGGAPVSANDAQALGLIDAVVEEGLWVAAVTLGAEMAAEALPPRRTRDRREGMRDAAAYQAAVLAGRALAEGRLPAPGRIVDCVEAALLLPFDQGLVFERAAFDELLAGPESAGMRQAFFAERRTGAFPEATAAVRPVTQVGLLGLGRTGAAMAFAALRAGLRVTAVAKDSGALVSGLGRVAELQENAVAAGRMTGAERDADWDRLLPATGLAALVGADLVIEALPEDEMLKAQVLVALAGLLQPGATIATTVAWLDPAVLAAVSGRAADVVGLGLGLPDQGMRLAEIAVAPETAADAVATLAALMRRMGWLVVRVRAREGLVGNRLAAALRSAADMLLEEGAVPGQVDAALRAFGFALGPYQALDLMGLERDWAQRARQAAEGRAPPATEFAELLVEAGRLGQETGHGYYLHDEGIAKDDPDVQALLEALRTAKGTAQRSIGDDEIRLRCLSAMANEGARVLDEGVALRPSDIDAAMVAGYGFPRWESGPMAWAAARGLLLLRADLRRFAPQAPAFWAASPLIDRLIRDGKTLGDLDPR